MELHTNPEHTLKMRSLHSDNPGVDSQRQQETFSSHNVLIASGVHLVSYSIDIRSFPGLRQLEREADNTSN